MHGRLSSVVVLVWNGVRGLEGVHEVDPVLPHTFHKIFGGSVDLYVPVVSLTEFSVSPPPPFFEAKSCETLQNHFDQQICWSKYTTVGWTALYTIMSCRWNKIK